MGALFFIFLFFRLYVSGCFVCKCVCVPCAGLVTREARRGQQISGTGVKVSCEHPHSYWKSKPGPLEGQPELLTTESPLQPPSKSFHRLITNP